MYSQNMRVLRKLEIFFVELKLWKFRILGVWLSLPLRIRTVSTFERERRESSNGPKVETVRMHGGSGKIR